METAFYVQQNVGQMIKIEDIVLATHLQFLPYTTEVNPYMLVYRVDTVFCVYRFNER